MELNQNNYYSKEADKEYFSASQIKSFMDCEARTMAELNGEYIRTVGTPLLVGSYVDAYFEGTLEEFKANHPEILNKRTGELKADFVKAEEMIGRAVSDKVFLEYMQGEKQKIVTGKIAGLPFKAKLDVYKEHERIVDLKTTRDFASAYVPGSGRVRFDEVYHYPLQMAIYQELIEQETGEKLPTILACVTKEEPSDLGLFQYRQSDLDTEMEILKQNLPRYDAIKHGILEPERCGRCAYCRATRKLTAPVIFTEEEIE